MIARLFAFLSLAVLAACGTPPADEAPPPAAAVPPQYQALVDGEYEIPAVEAMHLFGDNARQEVAYAGSEKPGSIVVDIFARRLYYVMEGGRAMRYGIAVGREGLSFKGTGYIGRKAEWPSWQPTANMIRTRPDLYAEYAAGLPGGLDNPLGARALYLYRGGRDTMFRIHGTIDNASIGRATSAGCIRLFNQDIIDLYNRVESGAFVKVRTLEESLAAEGPFMDDAYGRVVPDTPENQLQKEADIIAIAEAERKAVEDARLANEQAQEDYERQKRLAERRCRNKRIPAEECELPAPPVAAETVTLTDGRVIPIDAPVMVPAI